MKVSPSPPDGIVTNRTEANRIKWLDELRGIAAMCVVLHHLILARIGLNLLNYIDPGTFGVTVFFCISGYIIPKSIQPARPHEALRFLKARLFRLYPAYWVSLLLGAAAFHSAFWPLLINTTMLQRLTGTPDIVGVYWTLQVEIIFYLLIVGIVVLRRFNDTRALLRIAIATAALALCMGLGRAFLHHKFPIAPPIGLTIMFLIAGYASQERPSATGAGTSGRQILVSVALICLLLYASFVFGYNRDWGYHETPSRFIVTDSLGVLLFFYYRNCKIRSATLQFLGSISYSMYLVHTSIIALADRYFGWPPLGIPALALKLGIIVLVSWIVYELVEQPFIRLGRRFFNPREPDPNLSPHVNPKAAADQKL